MPNRGPKTRFTGQTSNDSGVTMIKNPNAKKHMRKTTTPTVTRTEIGKHKRSLDESTEVQNTQKIPSHIIQKIQSLIRDNKGIDKLAILTGVNKKSIQDIIYNRISYDARCKDLITKIQEKTDIIIFPGKKPTSSAGASATGTKKKPTKTITRSLDSFFEKKQPISRPTTRPSFSSCFVAETTTQALRSKPSPKPKVSIEKKCCVCQTADPEHFSKRNYKKSDIHWIKGVKCIACFESGK